MITNGPVYLNVSRSALNYSTFSVVKNMTAYSDIFELVDCDDFSIDYKITCTGTPSVQFQLYVKAGDDSDWVIPENTADINSSCTDKNAHLARLALPPARYIKILCTELTNSVTDTVVTIRIIAQRKYSA
jgi:hypothetical protein